MGWEWWAWGKKRLSEQKDVGKKGAQKEGGELEGGEGEVRVNRDLPASGLQGDKSWNEEREKKGGRAR